MNVCIHYWLPGKYVPKLQRPSLLTSRLNGGGGGRYPREVPASPGTLGGATGTVGLAAGLLKLSKSAENESTPAASLGLYGLPYCALIIVDSNKRNTVKYCNSISFVTI